MQLRPISSRHGTITSKLVALGEVPWWIRNWIQVHRNSTAPACHARNWLPISRKCFDFAIENLEDNDNSCGYINKDMALFLKARFCLFEGTFRKYHTELNLPIYSQRIIGYES